MCPKIKKCLPCSKIVYQHSIHQLTKDLHHNVTFFPTNWLFQDWATGTMTGLVREKMDFTTLKHQMVGLVVRTKFLCHFCLKNLQIRTKFGFFIFVLITLLLVFLELCDAVQKIK